MAAQYTVTTGSTALVAATAKTVIEITTPTTNPSAEWISMDISFNGVTASAIPVTVEICTYTATGTGTAYTPKRVGTAVGVSALTSKINDTVEPTSAVVQMAWFVPPTSGMSYQWPLGREIMHNVNTIMGIRLTAPAVVNYIVNVTYEE